MKKIALTIVPAEWRPAVAHDLEQERAASNAGAMWFAAQAARAGLRLRLARVTDRLLRRHQAPRAPEPRRRWSIFNDMARDIRIAVRRALANPGHALAVVTMLALGIGANTAIYSMFNHVLFRPLPGVARPSELVTIRFQTAKRDAQFFVSYRDYADLRDGIPGLELSASSPLSVDLAVPGARDPQRATSEIVTTNYFSVFRVTPSPGRDFLPSEEQPVTTTPPAIISRALWRSLYSNAADVIGKPLTLNGKSYIVVGVAPPGFQGRSLITPTDVWVPMGAHLQLLPTSGKDMLTNRRSNFFGDAYGRLRPGVTLQVAQDQATAVATGAASDFMGRRTRRNTIGPVVYEGIGQDTYAKARLDVLFKLVMGSVALVLLLACANAANLLLARALGRRREIAVCQAIGASRFRIVRQQLVEGLVLATAAGVLGLGIAKALTQLFDGMRLVTFLPVVKDIAIDSRVLTFAMLASLITGVLFATAPAFVASRVNLNASLKDGLTSSRTGRRLLRGTLAAVQVAVCVLLLAGAALFIRTLNNIRALDLGMQVDGVVTYSVDPYRHGISDAAGRQYMRDMLTRLRAVPGFESASYSWTTPYLPMRDEEVLIREADAQEVDAAANTVSPGFFSTMGIPLVAGRDFTEGETWTGKPATVAIISERLARAMWPDRPAHQAVGSRVTSKHEKKTVEVVGVVGDVRGRPITDDPEPYYYEPAGQSWGRFHVKSALPAAASAEAIREIARSLNAPLPPYDLEPFTAAIDRVLAEQRVLARISGMFAALAIVLAAMGLYAMMTGAVSERMREFGIRLALGARPHALIGLVTRAALLVTVAGIGAGLAAAFFARQVIESRLYGVSSGDPATLAGACALIVAIALIASAIPASRATQADPVRALRIE